MNDNTQNSGNNVDDLLDMMLDDLSDVPTFKPFPAGAHNCSINWRVTTVNELPSVELKLTYIEPIEIADTEAVIPAKGDTTNVLFMLQKMEDGKKVKNELAEGQFKEILQSLQKHLELEKPTPKLLMEGSDGLECAVITTVRVNKKDKDDIKYYTAIKSLEVV